jgi:benzoate 4-monooxygenase
MEQHRKYGDLVQIAPDHVSFNLPEAVADIYGHKSGCLKSDFYDSFLQVMPVVFNVRDPTAHQRKRKFLNLAFSARALSEFEPSMDVELSCWRRQLMDISKSDAVTDFTVWGKCRCPRSHI